MELKKKKIVEPYDLWQDGGERVTRSSCKLHPSLKRSRKNPLPHPGQSYNPDPEDHQKLLEKIARKELEHVKKQKSLKKALDVKVNRKELVKDAQNELLAGIKHLIGDTTSAHDSDASATDGAYSDYDEKDFAVICKDKKVVEKRKSRQQRMRQMKDKLQRKAAKLRKLKNIRLSKIDAIKKITKELEKKGERAGIKEENTPQEEQKREILSKIGGIRSDLLFKLRVAFKFT